MESLDLHEYLNWTGCAFLFHFNFNKNVNKVTSGKETFLDVLCDSSFFRGTWIKF